MSNKSGAASQQRMRDAFRAKKMKNAGQGKFPDSTTRGPWKSPQAGLYRLASKMGRATVTRSN